MPHDKISMLNTAEASQPASVHKAIQNSVAGLNGVKPPVPFDEPIFVAKPALPPLEKVIAQLESIWNSRILSNQGPIHQKLQVELQRVLRAENITLFCNGTLALALGLRALGVQGEIITTPFTFPATPHSVLWNNATPVFCDIDRETLCIDPDQIEALISPRTEGILGVHVYGLPCDVKGIQRIAEARGLKVAYDAAHAFMCELDGQPIGSYGDLTMFSFHATKLFHTVEGGCLVYNDPTLKSRLDLLKNFGIRDEDTVELAGLNAKLNELQSAIGLEMLRVLNRERELRKAIRMRYIESLEGIEGLKCILIPPKVTDSLQYMAIRIDAQRFGLPRDELYTRLKSFNLMTRKYFFPLCTDYAYRNPAATHLPNATKASQEILCLPFYSDLGVEAVERIAAMIRFLQAESRKHHYA